MTTTKQYPTGNLSTREFFSITSVQKFNTYIKISNMNGFVCNKIISNKDFKSWIK